MSNKPTLKLPRLVEVDDYHQFGGLQAQLRDLTGSNLVKVKEIACIGFYIGVVYYGVQPNKAAIKKLAAAQGLNLAEEED